MTEPDSAERVASPEPALLGVPPDHLFRLLVEGVRDYAIFAMDLEGRIVTWNEGAERIKGYRAEEIVGRHFSVFYPREKVEIGFPDYELDVAAAEGSFEDEGWRIRQDGSRFWANVVITALRSHEGELLGYAKVTRDLTERRRAEEVAESEARLRLIAEQIEDVFYVMDVHQGRTLYLSPGVEEMWQRSREEIADLPAFLRESVLDEDRPIVDEAAARQLRGEATDTEYRIARPDGAVRWVHDRSFPVRREEGSQRTVGVIEDVTRRRRQEDRKAFLGDAGVLLGSTLDPAEILASLARLAVPRIADWCSIDILEEDGTLRTVEVAHRDPAKVSLVRRIRERYPPEAGGEGGMREIIEATEPLLFREITEELLRERSQGEEHLALLRELDLVSAMVIPMVARERQVGSITLATDQAGRRFDEEDLLFASDLAHRSALAVANAELYGEAERARQEAEAASRAKSDFLAVMSHELRTPLNAILGYVELLSEGLMGDVAEAQRSAMERIEASALHLIELIDEILSLSRIEAGTERVQVTDVELRALVEETAALLEPDADRKGLELEITTPDRPVLVRSDPRKIRQVILNLLSNAVKYTGEGRVGVVLGEDDSGWVRIEVADTGPGIPEDELDRVFEPFSRSTVATGAEQGTGLGLPLSRRYARLLGGRLEVDCTPAGCVFALLLPRRLG